MRAGRQRTRQSSSTHWGAARPRCRGKVVRTVCGAREAGCKHSMQAWSFPLCPSALQHAHPPHCYDKH